MAESRMYPVMERFPTLQGEGMWTGHAAWFIRLGGCDVGMHVVRCQRKLARGCSSPSGPRHTGGGGGGFGIAPGGDHGGEPAMHDLGPLTEALKGAGLATHLETSGTHPVSGHWDWVTLSPKKFKPCLEPWYALADELKVVVVNSHDLAWAEEHASQLKPGALQFLQPEWDRRHEVMERVLNRIQEALSGGCPSRRTRSLAFLERQADFAGLGACLTAQNPTSVFLLSCECKILICRYFTFLDFSST